jgi:hypothetical protein
MSKTKRQETLYDIVVDGGVTQSDGTRRLRHAGQTTAFTPEQARRRAAARLLPITRQLETDGEVVLYAVPHKSWQPGKVARVVVPVTAGGDHE